MELSQRKAEEGFSLIEALVAALIVTVALMSLLALFGMAARVATASRLGTQARDQAQQVIESIFAARNAGSLSFSAIQNAGPSSPTGVFVTGYNPMYKPGLDGVPGTLDDDTSGLQTDADGNPLTVLQRQISIQPVNQANGTPYTNVRSVTVSIQYTVFGATKTYSQQTYISAYR